MRRNHRPIQSQGGYLLAGAVLLLVLFSIFAPLLVRLSSENTKRVVRQNRSDAALQLAEAGVSKALWKLTRDDKSWTTVCDGGVLAGFNNDIEYSDLAGGTYKIRMESTGSPQQVKVVAKGRDALSNEVRTIEATYGQPDVALAQLSPIEELNYTSITNWQYQSTVHWGSIWSYSSINMNTDGVPSPNSYPFPRKFSAGKIIQKDVSPQSPNSDGKEYWAFEPLGEPPLLDFEYYRNKAKASAIPILSGAGKITMTGGFDAVATPIGSGYFLGSANSNQIDFGKTAAYSHSNPNAVIFVEDDTLNGTYVTFYAPSYLDLEAFVLSGSPGSFLDFRCGAMDARIFGATVPANAPVEYQQSDAMTLWTTSLSPVGAVITQNGVIRYNPGTTFSSVFAAPDRCCYPLKNVFFRGLLYLDGQYISAWDNQDDPAITVGVTILNGLMSTAWGNYSLFFDSNPKDRIKYLRPFSPERLRWKEINDPW